MENLGSTRLRLKQRLRSLVLSKSPARILHTAVSTKVVQKKVLKRTRQCPKVFWETSNKFQ